MSRRTTPSGLFVYCCAAMAMGGGMSAWGQTPVVGPPVRLDVAGGSAAANETSIGVSGANPLEIVASWNDWRESTSVEFIRMGVALSFDGGASWTDFLLRPPPAFQGDVEGDPMTAFDPRTGTIWVGAISFDNNGGLFVARKDPGAPSFGPAVMARVTGSADKGWMIAGPRPGEPDSTRLYLAYNQGLIYSDDMGDTWTSPVPLGFGIGYLPRVGPNGELYIAYWDFGTGMLLQRSLNGGASFTTHTIATRMDVWGTQDGSRFPGTFRAPSLVYLAVDPNDGTLYSVYFDTTSVSGGNFDVDLYFTKSLNQGTSWSAPTILNADGFPPGDQFFPWIEVDRYGRLHVVYFDSRHTGQNDDDVHGMFDAYYAYSLDRGGTWTEIRLTGASWDSDNDGLNRTFQFLGDYLGLAVAGTRIYPTYLDTSAGDPDVYTRAITLAAPADLNEDGVVDVLDLLLLIDAWGPCVGGPCLGDLNHDDFVDVQDLLLLLADWS